MIDYVYARKMKGGVWSCAKHLHEQLGIDADFDAWISALIKECELKEHFDYVYIKDEIFICTDNTDHIGNKMRVFIINSESEIRESNIESEPEIFEGDEQGHLLCKYDWWLYTHFFDYDFPYFPPEIIKELSYEYMQQFILDYVNSPKDVREGICKFMVGLNREYTKKAGYIDRSLIALHRYRKK